MPTPTAADRPDLTADLLSAIANPAEADGGFDIDAQLRDVLGNVGLSPDVTGGEIRFRGLDPIVPSTVRLGAASALGLAAKSVAAAALWRDRTGEGQDISVDLRRAPHRLCPFYDRRWELLNGYAPGAPANPSQALGFMFHQTADSRWVMPLNAYPKIKVAAQRLLGTPDDPDAVSAAIARWTGVELEEAGADAGVVMPLLRTTAEFMHLPQYRDVISRAPLVEITRIGDSDPEPLPTGASSPLDGVRALGMGHVIAGAGVGRALALHGADVLNVWRPNEFEHDTMYATANVGVRSCTLNPRHADANALLRRLLAGADIFYANRRPGYLDKIGFSDLECAAVRPGIVVATNSLYGESGPWSNRVGFDQTAGSVAGIMLLEGTDGRPQLPPILVVNDYIVSWLTAAGVMAALRRRSREGGSYRVHVGLTRVALWILSLGVFDRAYAHAVAGSGGEHAYLDPETFEAMTPLGHYQGVTDQVEMTRTPGSYRDVLLPRGSSKPEWRQPN